MSRCRGAAGGEPGCGRRACSRYRRPVGWSPARSRPVIRVAYSGKRVWPAGPGRPAESDARRGQARANHSPPGGTSCSGCGSGISSSGVGSAGVDGSSGEGVVTGSLGAGDVGGSGVDGTSGCVGSGTSSSGADLSNGVMLSDARNARACRRGQARALVPHGGAARSENGARVVISRAVSPCRRGTRCRCGACRPSLRSGVGRGRAGRRAGPPSGPRSASSPWRVSSGRTPS